MATIIDALAITLALDATKFIKGQKEIEFFFKENQRDCGSSRQRNRNRNDRHKCGRR